MTRKMDSREKKKIIILSKGFISGGRTTGGMGPIMNPFYEELRHIKSMLYKGVKINEILEDGTELELTPLNVDFDNNTKEKFEETKQQSPQTHTQQNQKPVQNQQQKNNQNQKSNQSEQKPNSIDLSKGDSEPVK